MAKEKKIMFSYRVPESLHSEISKMVKLRINEYERDLLLGPDAKKEASVASSDAGEVQNWKKKLQEKEESVAAVVKDVSQLKDLKTKPTLEDLYEFEVVSGFPDQDDCVFVDKKLTACYSKYDLGIFYVKFEGRILKFTNKKSFERFSKEHLVPM